MGAGAGFRRKHEIRLAGGMGAVVSGTRVACPRFDKITVPPMLWINSTRAHRLLSRGGRIRVACPRFDKITVPPMLWINSTRAHRLLSRGGRIG